MVLQQFGGVNAIGFYASSIFVSAGKTPLHLLLCIVNEKLNFHGLSQDSLQAVSEQ